MEDPYFNRAVILLCDHTPEGSFGFILNKYVEISPEDLVTDLPELNSRVSLGGPVQNENLYYLHTLGDALPGSLHVTNDMYIGGEFDLLVSMIKAGNVQSEQVRFFMGYSGWDVNQLAGEMSRKSWYVCEADGLPLMDTNNEELWSLSLTKMGGEFARLANFPADPNLN